MKNTKTLGMIGLTLIASACGDVNASIPPGAVTVSQPQSVSAPASDPTQIPAEPARPSIAVDPAPASTPVSASIALRTYSVTETEAPINGWVNKTFTATGTCVQYQSKTYCWDDGVQTIPAWTVNNFTYPAAGNTYFGLSLPTPTHIGLCTNSCVTDAMAAPRIVAGAIATNIPAATIAHIFTIGVAKDVECTESNGILDCVDFQIDLNQAVLY